MSHLTIGQIAGVINVAVVIAQLTFPLAVVFIVVGILKPVNNAITWSVVGRLLNGSFWPTLLRTDTAATTSVSKRVVTFSTISVIGLLLLAIASIVTPLGLSEAINAGPVVKVAFKYAPDLQPMGRGTLSRAEYKASRTCGWFVWLNCPGQAHGFTIFSNATGSYVDGNNNSYISTTIPSNLTEIFGSGSTGDRNAVAGLFDIQYRSYIRKADQNSTSNIALKPNMDQGRLRTAGSFHMYESLILNDRYDIVEGLIVATTATTQGIGFRNHTTPISPSDGAEWTEGLLWIQPETVCVPSNLSLEFDIPYDFSFDQRLSLRDDGGISNLQRDYPFIDLNDTQARPELRARAHKGAVLNNFNLMKFFNDTRNSTRLGKTYKIPTIFSGNMAPNQVFLDQWTDFADGPLIPGINLYDPLSANITSANQSQYIGVGVVTQGFGSEDNANISFIAAATGLLLGAASRIDNPTGDSRLDPGTKWTAPIHSCASALKAFVMDVTFSINGSASLSNLNVKSAVPRTYNTNATTPLWAIENTGMNIGDVAPYWGLVADRYETHANLWTMRKPSVYLPAGVGFQAVLSTEDASAGAQGPESVLREVYADALSFASQPSVEGLPDYTGSTNFPMFLKWQNLSRQADTTSTIINLVWTDIAANYLIGARSNPGIGLSGPSKNTQTLVSVRLFSRETTYDLKYAIPAFIFLAGYSAILAFALALRVLSRAKPSYVKNILNQTATGRAVAIERHGSAVAMYSTKRWIQKFGHETIEVDPRVEHAPVSKAEGSADAKNGEALPLKAGSQHYLQEDGQDKTDNGEQASQL